jgi:type IV pilus assembly protein PilM
MSKRDRRQIVGLDIGTHSIKLIQLKQDRGVWELLNFGIMPLQPEAVIEGVVMDADAVVNAIKNLVNLEKITARDAVTSVSGHSVMIKKITLPLMNEKELEKTIFWEAKQYIPFDPDDTRLDFQILENAHSSESEPGLEVLLIAAKRDKVEDYNNLILEAGLNPVIIDVDSFALENCYELNYGWEAEETIGLIDIGASMTKMNIIKNRKNILVRDLAVGADLCTKEIQKAFDTSYEDAEALKLGSKIEGIPREKIVDIVERTLERIARAVQDILVSLRKEKNTEIDRLFLSGGCSLLKGIDRFFTKKIDIPAEVINPFQKIRVDEEIFDREYIEKTGPLAAVAVGLAIRTAENG